MTQLANIDSEYRNYSRGTQQSLQAWSGEQIDLGLVRQFFFSEYCLQSYLHLATLSSMTVGYTKSLRIDTFTW